MTTYKVKIKEDYIEKLKSSEDFILAIQLSRIINSLRSNFRSYINVSNSDDLLDLKDRIDLLLIHGAMLYEAIHEFSSMSKRLAKLVFWRKNAKQIKMLQRENNDKDSFTNTVLKSIRNKIFFHFDKKVIRDALSKFNLHDEPVFIIGKSTSRKDMRYSLADDLVLTYLVNLFPKYNDMFQRYEEIREKIIKLSDTTCSVFDNIIGELLKDKLDIIKED